MHSEGSVRSVQAVPLSDSAVRARRFGVRTGLVFGLAALLVLGLLALALRPASPDNETADGSSPIPVLRIGAVLPDFTLLSLDGTPFTLSKQRGHPVLLNFWATWCPSCKDELPALEHAHRSYQTLPAARRPSIVGVDASAENKQAVARLVARYRLTYPSLLDPNFRVTLNSYHLFSIPVSLLVDSRGILRSVHQGPMTYQDMRQALDGLH